ncbi:MAG: hypothetical protein A3I43_04030 [Omnitrophica WOR_2 bacterium RIFCSPLOWO2_02_FULL_50_19]|nr:MAG: hypothetical protein A3I43_04030 [Omnitrophica WOR_2 bacterium RIFCSPLOWO2_02_FULL_50_19]
MKRIILLVIAFYFISSLAHAVDENTMELKGTIVDNLSASFQKPADLPKFMKTYTKSSALKPDCAASGYSIYADKELLKFDGPPPRCGR